MTDRKKNIKISKKSKTQERNNKIISKSISEWERNNKLYIPIEKIINRYSDIKIFIIENEKGTGKTTQSIDLALKLFKSTKIPSVLLRISNEEIKEFYPKFSSKYFSGNFPKRIGFNGVSITEKGIFKESTIDKNGEMYYKQIQNLPVLLFGSINLLTKRSSVPFPEKINLVIIDEITNPKSPNMNAKDIISLFLSLQNILRGKDPKALLIFTNPNIESNFFYQKLGISKIVKNIPIGKHKIIKIKNSDNEIIKIYFSKFQKTKNLKEIYSNSEINKFTSLVPEIKNHIMFGENLYSTKFTKISKLGDFKFILIIDSNEIGVWFSKDKKLQFSWSKNSKNSKKYYFNFLDFQENSKRAKFTFIQETLISSFENNKVEFEDQLIFVLITNIIKSNQSNRN